MNDNRMLNQVVDYQKTLFDNSLAMMTTFQDQGHQMMDQMLEKNPLLPGDSKKMCKDWTNLIKQNQEICISYVNSNFDNIKDMFAKAPEPDSSVVKKTSTKTP